MLALKNNTPNTFESIKGKIFVTQSEDREYTNAIDRLDLENDYLKLKEEKGNIFPVNVFPKVLQEVIFEGNDKFQFSLDYIGSGILSAISTTIGVSFKVGVKTGWHEKVNLFMVIVGRPGDSKSHALDFCYKPIHVRESLLFKEYEKGLQEFEDNEQEIGESKKKIKKPILNKYLISDFTPEALIQAHYNNKKGLCVFVDELNGWLKNFNRYNNSGETETYLSLWSGKTISTDRASGKCLRVEDPFIGVVGSTQIQVLKDFAKNGRSTNGFMDRLLFVYPCSQKTFKWNINKVDDSVLENYFAVISNLIDLGNEVSETPVIIPIEESAKKHLFDWQNNRPEDYLFDYERSIEIKLQQYVIRFALIIQLSHHVTDKRTKNEIELFSIKGAIQLFHYFHTNALKVRSEISKRDYLETLTELQKSILIELPKIFTTGEGVKIACRMIKDIPRISERQFKTYLKDVKLFKRISHGNYEKLI